MSYETMDAKEVFETPGARLSETEKYANSVASLARELADRLCGSSPEAGGANKTEPVPNGFFNEINHISGNLNASISKTEMSLRRILNAL